MATADGIINDPTTPDPNLCPSEYCRERYGTHKAHPATPVPPGEEADELALAAHKSGPRARLGKPAKDTMFQAVTTWEADGSLTEAEAREQLEALRQGNTPTRLRLVGFWDVRSSKGA